MSIAYGWNRSIPSLQGLTEFKASKTTPVGRILVLINTDTRRTNRYKQGDLCACESDTHRTSRVCARDTHRTSRVCEQTQTQPVLYTQHTQSVYVSVDNTHTQVSHLCWTSVSDHTWYAEHGAAHAEHSQKFANKL